MVRKVVQSKRYNFVVVLMSDEEMAQLMMAIQYLRATRRGRTSMSSLMREAFKEWLENHKDVKEYINANMPLLEKTRSQQAQEAGQA
ncbi:MAG: hypothetical protein RXO24_08580 [Acidilobus sp.]